MHMRHHYTLTKPYYFFNFKTSNFKLHRRGPCVGMCLGTLGTYVPSEPV